MIMYAEATMYDIERARDGVLTIEYLGENCYRFYNYDDENPTELWENYHRTFDSRKLGEQEAIDALNEWLGRSDE
jgi:hypothetical protein